MINKYFVNCTDKPFTWSSNSESWTFQPGEKKIMPAWLAEHFAKHLTDSMLLASGWMVDDQRRPEFLSKCLFDISGEAPMSVTRAEVEALNAEPISMDIEEAPKKRMGRPKKVVEEKFEGLEA